MGVDGCKAVSVVVSFDRGEMRQGGEPRRMVEIDTRSGSPLAELEGEVGAVTLPLTKAMFQSA